ncbi:MAG TPA: ribosome recycling factor [Alphaproteobacteria bacterium]|nr:ribosome recycling factor [Alphaproteobacteria bacterium]USO06135.1 MAG: ribosome recycling factor [Rhodospirillales bacterium]HOO82234.1 ribosome recycling factor [Alphaproteobacteria bacterium]
MSYNKNEIKRRMDGAIDNLAKEFGGLRTGRASVNLLDPVVVEVYGSKMPLNQLGTVSVPEPRMLSVQVWDGGNVKAVEKAIRDGGLGLNPMPEGNNIRIPIPDLNEERRSELTKIAGKYAENTRISVRNVRKDGMDAVKKDDLPEDEEKRLQDEVQKLTDEAIKKIDTMLADKEKDIMTV